MDKEKWIRDIMDSAKHKLPVEPVDGFTERFINRLAQNKNTARVIPARWLSIAACAACILLLFNIVVLNEWKTHKSKTREPIIHETAGISTSAENLNQDYNFFN